MALREYYRSILVSDEFIEIIDNNIDKFAKSNSIFKVLCYSTSLCLITMSNESILFVQVFKTFACKASGRFVEDPSQT